MAIKLDVDIRGEAAIHGRINDYLKNLKTMDSASQSMGYAVLVAWKDVMDHFKKEEGPGGKWVPLAARTLAWKKKRGYKGMLKNTGNLRQRTTMEQFGGKGIVANTVDYAVKHQFGLGVPARPFLWISEQAEKRIVARFFKYVVK